MYFVDWDGTRDAIEERAHTRTHILMRQYTHRVFILPIFAVVYFFVPTIWQIVPTFMHCSQINNSIQRNT